MEIRTGCFDDGLDVFHCAFGLLADIAAEEFVVAWIERDLPGSKQEAVGLDGLRVRADGFWAFVGKHDVFHGVAS